MLKDITLGQYYPTESIIHRLDPRVKLLATLMYIVSLFLFRDFVGFVVVTLFLLVIIKQSRVPFSFMLKGVRAIWVLVVITAVCVIKDQQITTFTDATTVTFKELSNQEIEDYLDTNEWQGKAGAYAIQGIASKFVEKIDGDLENVIGMPMYKVIKYLEA